MTSRERSITGTRGVPLEHHLPRVLANRVDALYLAFRGSIRVHARAMLAALAARASVTKSEAAFALGELRGALSTRSREGWWLVQSAWLRVVIDEGATQGWTVVVEPTALLLMREGPRSALEMARSAARAILDAVLEERVRRLDLCADVVNFDLASVDRAAFVRHKRVRLADISTLYEYHRAGKRTGFVAGKGDAVARIYDKTEHLRLGMDETKREDEFAEWSINGWNGRDDVVRVEYQLRGRLLKELELRDPETMLERLDGVWSYCVHRWLRLVEIGTASRPERCRTDARWLALFEVVFRVRSEPVKRVRAPSIPHARRMVSAVVNYNACEGLLYVRGGDARDTVANWSNLRAEAWIQEQLFDMARRTVAAAAADLVSRHDDACAAAAHLMEKQSAAAARFTLRKTSIQIAAVAA